MLLQQHRTQVREIFARARRSYELVGIRASFVENGDGFSAPNQLGAALPEALPAPDSAFGWSAIACSVPALHRLNRDAIPDSDFPPQKWSCQRRVRTCN